MFKTLHFKSLFLLLCLIIGGSSSAWGEETYSLTPNQSSTGSNATSYITTLTEFTHNGISWKMNYWNPNSLQIKTNESTSTNEFRFYNTSAFSGRITQVTIKFSALTVSDASKLMFIGGTTPVTSTSGGTAGTWNSSTKTLTWTPDANSNYTCFAFYQNGKAASGTNKLATSDAIVVTYTSAALSSIAVTTPPTTIDYKVGEAFSSDGMVVTGTYSDASTKAISGYTMAIGETALSDGDVLNSAGSKTVTITYDGKTCTQDITVHALSSISLSGTYPISFTEKDEFSHEGLVVTANYDDNSTKEVTSEVTFSGYDMNTVGQQTVTVSYAPYEGATPVTTNYNISVNAGTKYTVTFDACNGSCSTESLTESAYKGGVVVPEATMSGWEFYGWAETKQNQETTVAPIVTEVGEIYNPTTNITLYAVYKIVDSTTKTITGTNLTGSATTATLLHSDHPITYKISSKNDYSNPLRVYKNNSLTIAGANITKIVLVGNDNSYPISNLGVSNNGTYSNGIWTGNSTEVVFSAANQARVSSIQVTYTTNTTSYTSLPAPKAILSFDSEEYVGVLGGTFTAPILTNTNNVTVAYSSSNTSVASVDPSTGNVTLVGEGSTVITAAFTGNESFRANSASYELTVRYGTIAQLKELTSDGTEVTFSAELTNAVITYVNDDYAYIQDATAAIMVKCSNHGLKAGNTITSIEGIVKAPNQIDQISAITEKTMGETGAIPTAEEKTLAEIITAGTEYDGKLVTVNTATVSNSMEITDASGASISDDNGTTSFNLYAPNKGITVNASEIGNFTGYVSIYNGSTYRLNLYEQSQIVLTQNAARDQELSFDEEDIVLDEETTDYNDFIGQDVKGAQGTVTYAIDGDAIGAVDNDGFVELNGTCGTATVTATAAAITKEVDGIPTPYKAATKSYTITVRPRYSVAFYVNGVEEIRREASYGEGVTVPSPAQLGDYYFVGWSTAAVETTDEAPSMPAIGATVYPEDNNGKYYAVYATKTVGEDQEIKYTNSGAQGTDATTGITAEGNINTTSSNGNPGNSFGLTSSSNKTITLTNIDASEATSAYIKFDYRLAKSGTSFSSLTVSQFNSNNQTLGTATQITGSDQTYHTTSEMSINTNCTKITIVCNPASSTYNTYVDNIIISITKPSIAYAGYTTSIPTPSITLGGIAGATETDYKFATFSADQAVVFTDDVTVYAVSVDENNNLVKTELTKDDYFVVGANSDGIVSGGYYVPANTGVMLRSTGTSSNYYFAATDESVTIPTNMMIAGTNTVPSETDYKYYKLTYEDASHAHIGFYWGAEEGAPFMTKKGKAYLRLPKTVNARGFSLFDDDYTTTGISTMHNSEFIMHNEVYNLNGQRVDNLKKGGLYIVNGKKVVIK